MATVLRTAAPTWTLTVDRSRHAVMLDAEPLDAGLSGKEFALLCALAREPERVWSREELMRDVWSWAGGAGLSRRLDSTVCHLRRKLPQCYLQNVWGVGYRLCAPGTGAHVRLVDTLHSVEDLHQAAVVLAATARRLAADTATVRRALALQPQRARAEHACHELMLEAQVLAERLGTLPGRIV